MATIDIIVLVFVGIGLLRGFANGFLKQLAGLLGLVIGLLAAKALYATVAERVFSHVTDSVDLAQGLAFAVVWVAVPLAFLWVASLLTRAMEAVSLGWLNRLLGAGLGAVKYALLASLLVGVVEYFDPGSALIGRDVKRESKLYYPLKDFAGMFFPTVREALQKGYEECTTLKTQLCKTL